MCGEPARPQNDELVQGAKREAREKARRNQERSKASGDAEDTLARLRAELANTQREQVREPFPQCHWLLLRLG